MLRIWIYYYLNCRILFYAFAIAQIADKLNKLKLKFDRTLVKRIERPNKTTSKFLHLCVDNYEEHYSR